MSSPTTHLAVGLVRPAVAPVEAHEALRALLVRDAPCQLQLAVLKHARPDLQRVEGHCGGG
eukprot:1193033-Prorocentrum_minimum.AAC.2